MNKRGQASSEMILLMPLLIMVLGGAMVIVYTCWQGIKVQQAANLAARVQGEERVAGGTSLGSIDDQNGVGGGKTGDHDPTLSNDAKFTDASRDNTDQNSVYGKYYKLVKDMFPGAKSQTYIPLPEIGQNVDEVKVVRLINLPNIPFFKWFGSGQIKLESTAWGGEDTLMYALPRWGQTGGSSNNNTSTPEWKILMRESAKPRNHD